MLDTGNSKHGGGIYRAKSGGVEAVSVESKSVGSGVSTQQVGCKREKCLL